MPRARSKSSTPRKAVEAAATASLPKRRRTRSLSSGEKDASLVAPAKATAASAPPAPSRTSPRRRRASSASEPSDILLEEKPKKTNETPKKTKGPTPTPKSKEIKKVETPKESTGSTSKRKSRSTSAVKSTKPREDDDDKREIAVPMAVDPPSVEQPPQTKIEDSAPQKHAPTMNVKVHRVRHLDYMPSSVLAMVSTPHQAASSYLALSRQDGSVELYEATSISEYAHGRSSWIPHLFPLATIAGSKKAVAHSLAFVKVPNQQQQQATPSIPALVAASPDGTLWTIQFAGQSRQLHSRISSGGGGVFDLTTCSSNNNSTNALPLVAGACQDGSVRIWQVASEIEENNKVSVKLVEPPLATLTTTGAPILSIAWRCVKQQASNHPHHRKYETEIFAGVADGTIRQYSLDLEASDDGSSINVLKHQAQLRMTVESRGRRTPTKVWTMQALEDGTLVTGNSLGQVQFWDTVSGTMIQSVNQTELKADVLKLVVNPSQTKLFASGVDARVLCLERANPTDRTWKFTTAQRPHTHDVKSMAILQGATGTSGKNKKDGSALEALVTAGVDTKLCTYVVADFAKRRPQVYYPWPSQSPVSSTSAGEGDSSSRRILSMQRANHLELYRLDGLRKGKKRKATASSASELIGDIAIETQSNLSVSSVSPNGQWLAAANATRLFLFRLKLSDDNETCDVEPEKVVLPKPLEHITAVALHFSGTTLFVADSTHTLYAVELSDVPTILSKVQLPVSKGKNFEQIPVFSLRSTPSSKFVVGMTKAASSSIHVFERCGNGNEVSYMHYWTIPNIAGARPAAIAVLGETQLAVATVSFQVYLFDLKQKKLTRWSESNGFPIERWPNEISYRKDFPVRLFGNPQDPSQLIMSSFGAFVVVNVDGELPTYCRMIPEMHVRRRRKRARDEEALAAAANKAQPIIFAPPKPRQQVRPPSDFDPNARNCTVCLHYNSMLHFDFWSADEMVVVEQPWLRVIANFPEALQRRVYGCN